MRREKGHGSVTDGRHKRTNGLRKGTSTSSIDIIVFWDILDQRLTVITVHQTSMSPWQGNPTAIHWLIWSGNPPALLASITQAADLSTEIGPLLLNGSTQSFYNKLDKPSELAVCQLFKNLAGASEHSELELTQKLRTVIIQRSSSPGETADDSSSWEIRTAPIKCSGNSSAELPWYSECHIRLKTDIHLSKGRIEKCNENLCIIGWRDHIK